MPMWYLRTYLEVPEYLSTASYQRISISVRYQRGSISPTWAIYQCSVLNLGYDILPVAAPPVAASKRASTWGEWLCMYVCSWVCLLVCSLLAGYPRNQAMMSWCPGTAWLSGRYFGTVGWPRMAYDVSVYIRNPCLLLLLDL